MRNLSPTSLTVAFIGAARIAALASFAAGDNFFDLTIIKGILPRITQGFYLAFTNNENNFTDLIVLGKPFNCMKKNGFSMNLHEWFFDSPAHAQSKTCPD